MADRKFDVVVFGASGVTGKYVLEELVNHYTQIKWAAAGRNRQKIGDALMEVGNLTGKDLQNADVIDVDVDDSEAVISMCKQTRLVINCVGPFRFYGEKIVSKCIEFGTHHIDVCGEPQFLESIQLKYFEAAKENNVYVVGACGFDSVLCDVGVEFIKDEFPGDVFSVETYLNLNMAPGTTVNFATWDSAVHGLAHASELVALRKELKEKVFTRAVPRSSFKFAKRPVLFKSDDVNGWCIPFIGSDKSVVYRTQMYNFQHRNQRPVQVNTYMCVGSLLNGIGVLFLGLIFGILANFSFGRKLLEKYPEFFSAGLFSHSPPRREEANKSSYSMTFKANGWEEKLAEPVDQHTETPNKELKVVLSAQDNGYITTAICVVCSALVVLEEAEKLPDVGGVFTPGAAFKDSSLLKRLQSRGLSYRILE